LLTCALHPSVPQLSHRKRSFYYFRAVIDKLGPSHMPNHSSIHKAMENYRTNWVATHPICLLKRNQLLALLRYPWASLEDLEGGEDMISARLFQSEGVGRVQAATESAADLVSTHVETIAENPGQISSALTSQATTDEVQSEQAPRGLVEADSASMDPYPTRSSMSSPAPAPPSTDQPSIATSRELLEANSPSLSPRPFAHQEAPSTSNLPASLQHAASTDGIRAWLQGVQGLAQSQVDQLVAHLTQPDYRITTVEALRALSSDELQSVIQAFPLGVKALIRKALTDASRSEVTSQGSNLGGAAATSCDEEDQYDELSDVELWIAGRELCEKLIKDGVVVTPPITWNGECGSEEKLAAEMAGFLYSMYRVEFWYWEIFEILRKLFIGAVLVHIHDPDIRLAIGFTVSFLALLITFSARPFASAKLNNLILSGHSIQTLTLFHGLLLGIRAKAGSNSAVSKFEMSILDYTIGLLNILLIVIPYVFGLLDMGISAIKSAIYKWTRTVKYTYIGPEMDSYVPHESGGDQRVVADLVVTGDIEERHREETAETRGYYVGVVNSEDQDAASADLVIVDGIYFGDSNEHTCTVVAA